MKYCVVHFNTPELTTCLCSSIIKNDSNAEIIMVDNSNQRPFDNTKLFNILYYDNTNAQIINFEHELEKYPDRDLYHQTLTGVNFGSAKHSMTIDWLCNKIKSPFILLDSDVLIKSPIDFADSTKIAIGDIKETPITNEKRFLPFILYINPVLMKKHKIKFFDSQRMHGLNKNTIYTYDTGASFYEDCVKTELYKTIQFTDYGVHFGNGSWRRSDSATNMVYSENGNYETFLMKYKYLWK